MEKEPAPGLRKGRGSKKRRGEGKMMAGGVGIRKGSN